MTVLQEGWAVGLRIPSQSDYLTIPGSAYSNRAEQLHATQDEATTQRPLDGHPGHVLARVRRRYHPGVTVTNEAFQIVEVAAEQTPSPT